MKFKSHQQKLVDEITIALTKNKHDLIMSFKPILSQAKKLFQTDQFDFWLSELGKHSVDEIPMTKYGLDDAKHSIKYLSDSNRNSMPYTIEGLCEALFTYWNDNEMDPMQYDFHYYYSLTQNTVFKTTGNITIPDVESITEGTYRIALRSELNVPDDEFVL